MAVSSLKDRIHKNMENIKILRNELTYANMFIIFLHIIICSVSVFIIVFCTNINIVFFGFICAILIYAQTIYCDGCSLTNYEGSNNLITLLISTVNNVILDEGEQLVIKHNHLEKLIVFSTVILFTVKLLFLVGINYVFGLPYFQLLCNNQHNLIFSYIL